MTFPNAWGSSLCWHCLRQFHIKKGGGFKFRLVADPVGNKHRVHLDCLPRVLEDQPELVECPKDCVRCEESRCDDCFKNRYPAAPSQR